MASGTQPATIPSASSKAAGEQEVRLRRAQWIYLGPLMAAPLAHIAVSGYRHAKTPFQKRAVLFGGVAGATAFSLGMRLYLMSHAGYAGGDISQEEESRRAITVSRDEKDEVLRKSLRVENIVKEASKGLA